VKLLAILFSLVACGGASPSSSTTPSTPPPAAPPAAAPTEGDAVVAQAALAEQYDVGKRIYVSKQCASCHGDHGEGNPKNPAVIGPAALPRQAQASARLRKGVVFETAKDVLAFVRTKMPLKTPGTLSDAEALAVTSWMLSESKVDIERPLDATNAVSIKLR
jgi:cytochrome c